MATPVIMPRQGQSVESCIITQWYVKKGEQVKVGDLLLNYETDKATFDEEAKEEGVILDIFFEEGDDVPVLTNICVIGQEGEDASQFDPRVQTDQGVNQGETEKAGETEETEKREEIKKIDKDTDSLPKDLEIEDVKDGIRKISPRARNLADKMGIDFRYGIPTGPEGRIIERDIVTLVEQGPSFTLAAKDISMEKGEVSLTEGTGIGGRIRTDDFKEEKKKIASGVSEKSIPASSDGSFDKLGFEEVQLTNIRKVIAKTMYQSLSTTAQLTLNTTFDATEIMEYRKKIKEGKDRLGIQNITINDIVLFAVSRTLPSHKFLNAYFLENKIRVYNSVHMGVAIDTERGLMVPTIFNANHKTLDEISKEVKKVADECQKGTINPDLLQGGTFTVTNLGTLDIESFTPVLNPPQTGILGVNTIVQRVREVDGKHVLYPAMGLSLTFDHRAIDGAPAARFLKELKTNLENFSILLAK